MELLVVYICLLRLLGVKAICLGRLIFTLGTSISASCITVESLIIYSMCRLIWPPRPGSALIYLVLSTVVYDLPSLSSIELKSAWLLCSSNSQSLLSNGCISFILWLRNELLPSLFLRGILRTIAPLAFSYFIVFDSYFFPECGFTIHQCKVGFVCCIFNIM